MGNQTDTGLLALSFTGRKPEKRMHHVERGWGKKTIYMCLLAVIRQHERLEFFLNRAVSTAEAPTCFPPVYVGSAGSLSVFLFLAARPLRWAVIRIWSKLASGFFYCDIRQTFSPHSVFFLDANIAHRRNQHLLLLRHLYQQSPIPNRNFAAEFLKQGRVLFKNAHHHPLH